MKPLDHFLRLALRGRHPGSSGGEKRARRLALALLDNVPGLDGDAIVGMVHFLAEVQKHPEATRTSIDGWDEE